MSMEEALKTEPPCHSKAVSPAMSFKIMLANGWSVCNTRYSSTLVEEAMFGSLQADLSVDCIQKNSYNEDKCQSQIAELYRCCNLFYERQGNDAHTVSCPKAHLLRLKMRQRAQGV